MHATGTRDCNLSASGSSSCTAAGKRYTTAKDFPAASPYRQEKAQNPFATLPFIHTFSLEAYFLRLKVNPAQERQPGPPGPTHTDSSLPPHNSEKRIKSKSALIHLIVC